MEDIFKDEKFEKFLYGGVRDLEEPVGQLIYNLWKAGITTEWSCSGHIGKTIGPSEKLAIDGHYVYDAGRLYYKTTPNSEPLKSKLIEICTKHSFATLTEREGDSKFILEMKDIALHCSERGYTELQVPIQLAERRYAEFLEIWRELTDWSKIIK